MWRWDVIDTIRALTGARTFAQVLTPSTSALMATRPEVMQFATATTFWFASATQQLSDPRGAGLPSLDEFERAPSTIATRAETVFVDPWHTYDSSIRVLELGLTMLTPGGWLVAHDCLPRDIGLVTPEPREDGSGWCGETWRAFADIAYNLPSGSRVFIIDSDFGIGVIQPAATAARWTAPGRSAIPTGLGPEESWSWYSENLERVVDVVTSDTWQRSLQRLLQ